MRTIDAVKEIVAVAEECGYTGREFYTPNLSWTVTRADGAVTLHACYENAALGEADPYRVERICKQEFQRHVLPRLGRALNDHGLEVRSIKVDAGKWGAEVRLGVGPQEAVDAADWRVVEREIRQKVER